ncbi:DUF3800 domain-containing protein [Oleidesulfovibrio sp.]|uniref:DUF3800 domain-containing protein n=1 Tax=Oleidesulfovibrio sp. TaxID=2909707 RepID=UPI003A8B6409
MYVYADESGNTGKNIFDAPAFFYQGVIMAVEDIDPILKPLIDEYCKANGVSRTHAHQMPADEVNLMCWKIIELLDGLIWCPHFVSICKPYLAPTKFLETFFDSFENEAVPNQWYNLNGNRLSMAYALEKILTLKNKQEFWSAFLEKDYLTLSNCLENALHYLPRYVNESSDLYDVLCGGLKYARRNVHRFTIPTQDSKRHGYKIHSPNGIGFTSVLEAAHTFANKHRTKVTAIIHDQNQEFKKTMEECHEFFKSGYFIEKHPDVPPLWEPAEFDLGKLLLKRSGDSPALQAVDIFTWIFQRKKDVRFDEIRNELTNRCDPFHISPVVALLMGKGLLGDAFFEQFKRKAFDI